MYVICLLGESGVGKSTLAQYMSEKYGFHLVKSYTTRERRITESMFTDHYFVTPDDYESDCSFGSVLAQDTVADHKYWVTENCFDLNNTNVYVTNRKGVDDLCKYTNWELVVVEVKSEDIPADRKDRYDVGDLSDFCDLTVYNTKQGKDSLKNCAYEIMGVYYKNGGE